MALVYEFLDICVYVRARTVIGIRKILLIKFFIILLRYLIFEGLGQF